MTAYGADKNLFMDCKKRLAYGRVRSYLIVKDIQGPDSRDTSEGR
jgi:hypothetical protein